MATRRTISRAFGEFRRRPDESVDLRGRDPRFRRAFNRGVSIRQRGRASFEFRIGHKLRRGPANGCVRAKALTDRGDDLNVQRSKDRFPLI